MLLIPTMKPNFCWYGMAALLWPANQRPNLSIQTWTDSFIIYSSIYAAAHPECTTALFKYIHTVRLGASRSPGLGWRDYDVQFRLKKEQNPNMSFAMVDQELWLLYMQAPLFAPKNNPEQIGKCYDFNYRGSVKEGPAPINTTLSAAHSTTPQPNASL